MTDQEIILKAKEYLKKVNINYIEESINEASYTKEGKLRNSDIKPVYMISFLRTFDDPKAENDLCFLFVDAKTFDFLYIMTSHGYIEIEKD